MPTDAPSNAFSGPGGLTFDIKFELPVQPVPFLVETNDFNVLTNLRYTLGTGPAIDLSNATVTFWDSTLLGMLTVVLPSPTLDVEFDLAGPVIFSGTLAQPTLLPGTFLGDPNTRFIVGGTYQPQMLGVVLQAQTPEPVTELLVGGALLGLAVIRRRRKLPFLG